MTTREPLTDLQNTANKHYTDIKLEPKSSLSDDDRIIYSELLAKGKKCAAEGFLVESLEAFKEAYSMKPTEKILGRIKKIEGILQDVEDVEEEDNITDDNFLELDNGLVIFKDLAKRLYPHQIEGVKWIYDLFRNKKKGGILADDMGLGKTIQVIAALSAMFDMEAVKHILLVLPLSLIPNWIKEFERWAPGIRVKCFHGSPRERNDALDFCQRRQSVCLTTYGLIQTQWEQLGQTKQRREFVWDYIILDEGHKIKNPTKTTKGLHSIPSKNRLILTGTPIQNNLRELWALFDWIMKGTLLGTQKTFKMEYETPITRARQRGASAAEIHLGNYMSQNLRKIVDPFILRRTKASVTSQKAGEKIVDASHLKTDVEHQPSFPKLKKKNDFVIWTYLSEIQETIYRDFLQRDSIKQLLASKRSPLVHLNVLKKICDHPRLLSRKACQELGLEANESLREEDFNTDKANECAANRIDNITDETLIMESGKLQFLIQLLAMLKQEGHRTLIFSLSRKVLNIIHRIISNKGFKVMRLDGTITKLSERELRVNKFQQDSSYEVFLLTTQVGGVGLTLTAADRVVIFDPSWNPATDAQAVDRIYRIGQDKNVVVYRLITCGTVEEKIYRRQIFKDSIIKQSTGDNKDPYRYFTHHELKELFELENTKESVTQRQLQDLHGGQRCTDSKLTDHLAKLHALPMFGISDHDLMFSQDPDDVDPDVAEMHRDSIHNKVLEAQSKVNQEARCFTGREKVEMRWGEFESRVRITEPRIKEEEPKFKIEGLYDKLNSLHIGDKYIKPEFTQLKTKDWRKPVNNKDFNADNKDSNVDIKESTANFQIPEDLSRVDTSSKEHGSGSSTAHLLVDDSPGHEVSITSNSVDEDTPSKKHSSSRNNEHLLADDSFGHRVGITSNSVDEIEESLINDSFKSCFNTPGKALFEADVSCIPSQVVANRTRDSAEVSSSFRNSMNPCQSKSPLEQDPTLNEASMNRNTSQYVTSVDSEIMNISRNSCDISVPVIDSSRSSLILPHETLLNEEYKEKTQFDRSNLRENLSESSLSSNSLDETNYSDIISSIYPTKCNNGSKLSEGGFLLDQSVVSADNSINENEAVHKSIFDSSIDSKSVSVQSVSRDDRRNKKDDGAVSDSSSDLPDFDESLDAKQTRSKYFDSKTASDGELIDDLPLDSESVRSKVTVHDGDSSNVSLENLSAHETTLEDTPLFAKKNRRRIIESDSESEDAASFHNTPVRSVGKLHRRRSSALPPKNIQVSDDSDEENAFSKHRNTFASHETSEASAMDGLQLSFESEDEDLI